MARLDNLDYEVNGVTTNYEIVPEIAPLFKSTTAYAAGDTVIEEGHLYRFNTAHAAGAWIGTDADEITVGEELTSHGADITELKADFTDMDGKIDASLITNTASGSIVSFPDGADNVPVKDLTVQIMPYQAGTGDPSPENVRPISGWTGAELWRTNDTLYRTTSTFGTISMRRIYVFDRMMKAGKYYLFCTQKDSPNTGYTVGLYMSVDGGDAVRYGSNYSSLDVKAFVLDRDCHVSAYINGSSLPLNTAFDVTLSRHNITGHIPKNGELYNITFPTEAGTDYGGKIRQLTGGLSSDWAKVTIDGSENIYSVSINENRIAFMVTKSSAPLWKDTSGASKTGAIANWAIETWQGNAHTPSNITEPNKFALSNNYANYHQIGVSIPPITIAEGSDGKAEIQAYMTEHPLDIFYPTIESEYITYQIEPVTDIKTLLGQNNIWADTGDTTVDYRADTKLYIEQLTAPTEDDMTANTNIPNATYFMVGNTLYLSTTTIPAGDVINPGTNCTQMNLASALNALNS